MHLPGLRILFVHSGSDLYGASRSLLRLGTRLVRDGAIVLTVLPDRGPLDDALRAEGVDTVVQGGLAVIERQTMLKLFGAVRLAVRSALSVISLLMVIRNFKPHLIHTMTAVIPTPGLAAKLVGTPHVWHIRESFSEFGHWWKYYQWYIAWFASAIICVSTPVAQQFEPTLRVRKVNVIHNGFPAAEFDWPGLERIQAFKTRYSLDNTLLLIGVVGRIKFQRKGQEIFVEAARALRARFPNARFLCIGSPFPGNQSHLDHLLKLIHDLSLEDYVMYTGDVADVKAAIAALDVLVLSSVQPEPFAGVVVEAMALSRPVVATRAGGSIEQVEDGVTGYLVEPGDTKSMADAIEKLLGDPGRRKLFGEQGRARFAERFEFEPFYEKMLSLYNELLNEAAQ